MDNRDNSLWDYIAWLRGEQRRKRKKNGSELQAHIRRKSFILIVNRKDKP